MKRTLLVTNDFPPKVGGIQTYLWELFRRLPRESVTVLTTSRRGAGAFDTSHHVNVVRDRDRVLLPHRGLARRIRRLAGETEAELVLLDPALPLGALGPKLGLPYGLIIHGAEVAIPAAIGGARRLLGRVLREADLVIAAGHYVATAANQCAGTELAVVEVPPGVDTARFVPLDDLSRAKARLRFGLEPTVPLVVGLSRLVPRKGFDRLIEATVQLHRSVSPVQTAIAGEGRDAKRLARLVERTGAPVTLLGRLGYDDVVTAVAMADVFAVPCRNRWRGLEQEGFGIVFLEAAAAGVPAVAGRSGGSHEAVQHGRTGLVIDQPNDAAALTAALGDLLSVPAVRAQMGTAARVRAAAEFDYAVLARRLEAALG